MKITNVGDYNKNLAFKAKLDYRLGAGILSEDTLKFFTQEVDKIGSPEDTVYLSGEQRTMSLNNEEYVIDKFNVSFIPKAGSATGFSEKQASGGTQGAKAYALKSALVQIKEQLGIF